MYRYVARHWIRRDALITSFPPHYTAFKYANGTERAGNSQKLIAFRLHCPGLSTSTLQLNAKPRTHPQSTIDILIVWCESLNDH